MLAAVDATHNPGPPMEPALEPAPTVCDTQDPYPRFEGDIRNWEKAWLGLYSFLAADGYHLRDRYNPNWLPDPNPAPRASGFADTGAVPWENRVRLRRARLMDAVRVHDGLRVMIKRIDLSRGVRHHEWNINRIFAPDEVAGNPRNHCVRLLDYLRCPGTKWELLVMPLMLPFDVTPFETVEEVVNFVRQMLEGIEFMHELNVAHRDIGPGNVVMYSPDLFPNGANYIAPGFETIAWSTRSPYRARREVFVRYYLIDFGLSWAFPDAASRHPLRIVRGQFKDVPEYAVSPVCDGFALDMWCIGRLIETEFVEKYRIPKFLRKFAAWLTSPRPEDRPTATAAFDAFYALLTQLNPAELKRPLSGFWPQLTLPKVLRRTRSGERAPTSPPLTYPIHGPPPVFRRTAEFRKPKP